MAESSSKEASGTHKGQCTHSWRMRKESTPGGSRQCLPISYCTSMHYSSTQSFLVQQGMQGEGNGKTLWAPQATCAFGASLVAELQGRQCFPVQFWQGGEAAAWGGSSQGSTGGTRASVPKLRCRAEPCSASPRSPGTGWGEAMPACPPRPRLKQPRHQHSSCQL